MRTKNSPASEAQKRYLRALLSKYTGDNDVREAVREALGADSLTDSDCREMIPVLKKDQR